MAGIKKLYYPFGVIATMSLVSRGLSVLLERGVTDFLEQVSSYVYDRIRTPVWVLKGDKTVQISGHSVTLRVTGFGDFREISLFDRHEREYLTDMLSELSATDDVLDVGANVGIYSLFAAEVGDRVYAIEPHPVNAARLVTNKHKNGSAVDIYQCAFFDSERYLGLTGERDHEGADGRASLSVDDNAPVDIYVRTEVGDRMVRRELATPNVVKIDVEGAENRVVDGLYETLSHPDCRVLFCEVHGDETELETLVSKIEYFGFEIAYVDAIQHRTIIKGKKPTL